MILPAVVPRYSAMPGRSMSRSAVSSSVSAGGGYRPSYAVPLGRYHSTGPSISPAVAHTLSSSKSSSSSSVKPAGSLSIRATGGSKYFDPTYPSRQFGSRLSKSYNAVTVRPQLHEEFYGTSYLPDYGRNSWSAYKLTDAAIDDGEDIAHLSRRKDYEAIRGAELAMANAAYVPLHSVKTVRASSVPPRSISTERRMHARTVRPVRGARPLSYHNAKKVSTASSVSSSSYGTEPKVKVVLETVPKGRDLLTAKEKLMSREVIDLESPSSSMALKMRIADAKAMLDRQGAMLGRYCKSGPDGDMAEVDEEVRRVKNTQALRAKSVI